MAPQFRIVGHCFLFGIVDRDHSIKVIGARDIRSYVQTCPQEVWMRWKHKMFIQSKRAGT